MYLCIIYKIFQKNIINYRKIENFKKNIHLQFLVRTNSDLSKVKSKLGKNWNNFSNT